MSKIRHLVDYFVPENYNLHLDIDKQERQFSGTVVVTGQPQAKEMRFHTKDLTIASICLDGEETEKWQLVDSEIIIKGRAEQVAITFAGNIIGEVVYQPGEALVYLTDRSRKLGALLKAADDRLRERLAVGDEKRTLVAGAVLRLREQIRRNPVRIGGVIGKNGDFAGTRHEVERNGAVNLAFGGRDVRISGPHDLEHGFHMADAVRHQPDGLDTAHAVGFANAADLHRVENFRTDGSVLRTGRARHDFGDPGGLGEGRRHDDRGSEGRRAAGDIDADALKRGERLAQNAAVRRRHLPVGPHRLLRERGNALVRLADARLGFLAEQSLRLLEFARRNT